tara:strand:- start:2376 stop:3551 length:1176 start_codon:yes stop_codon:yes gene_type:complete
VILHKKRKILIISGTRAEYGYVRPLLKLIENDPEVESETLVTNMHLLDKFGKSVREFEKDGIEVTYKIHNTLDGYTNATMVKSLGVYLLQLPEILEKSKPDIVLISGDRGEQLMSAIAASHLNIPVAHIQAGEKSGNIDGSVRHAITKISHIHFCANQDAYERVIKLGEDEFRVFNLGAPLIDEIVAPDFYIKDIRRKLNLREDKKIFLIVNHSITEESEEAGEQMKAVIDAVEDMDAEMILIMPNSDAGSAAIRKTLTTYGSDNLNKSKFDRFRIFYNLSRIEYISVMREAAVMIGNSSSGILEAPSFKLPVVNVGRRQKGRLQGKNVINCEYDKDSIIKAVNEADSQSFRSSLENLVNPYGDGRSSQKILNALKTIPLNKKLTQKEIAY